MLQATPVAVLQQARLPVQRMPAMLLHQLPVPLVSTKVPCWDCLAINGQLFVNDSADMDALLLK